MAEVEYIDPWIGDWFFEKSNPRVCKITSAGVEQQKGRNDAIITLDSEARMSVYGKNLEMLCRRVGTNTDSWIGMRVSVSQTVENGKKRRLLVLLA